MTPKPFLAGAALEELEQFCLDGQFERFRAKQIRDWIYQKNELAPGQMKNLPPPLKTALAEHFFAPSLGLQSRADAADGTTKLLLQLYDGETIEMVVIPAKDGRITFCLSTQVGCPVGCVFCASGQNGLVRNLAAGEILEEFVLGCQIIGRKPDNIVFMGIGEGLLNLPALTRSLEILTGEAYFGMSPRRITVSTSGYVPGMLEFAKLEKEYNLAISLHAVNDELRSQLIPTKLRYPIAEIMAAADVYLEQAGRMVTLEYILLGKVNDSAADAQALAAIAKKHHAKINLIPYNETGGRFRRPDSRQVAAFQAAVEALYPHVSTRVSRGGKGNAACGQLRIQHESKEK